MARHRIPTKEELEATEKICKYHPGGPVKLPFSEFYLTGETSDGYSRRCRTCSVDYQRELRERRNQKKSAKKKPLSKAAVEKKKKRQEADARQAAAFKVLKEMRQEYLKENEIVYVDLVQEVLTDEDKYHDWWSIKDAIHRTHGTYSKYEYVDKIINKGKVHAEQIKLPGKHLTWRIEPASVLVYNASRV